MIFQTSPGIHPELREYGCYIFVLLWHYARRHPERLLTVDVINQLYAEFIGRGFVGPDPSDGTPGYVVDPVGIMNHIGLHASSVKKYGRDRVCMDDEVEALLFYYAPEGWWHFVAGDGFGNPTYDPWGISTTATHGRFHSKRIIRLAA